MFLKHVKIFMVLDNKSNVEMSLSHAVEMHSSICKRLSTKIIESCLLKSCVLLFFPHFNLKLCIIDCYLHWYRARFKDFTERQILCTVTYMWNLEQSTS